MQHLEVQDLVARDDEIADAGFAIVVREQRPATCLDGIRNPGACPEREDAPSDIGESPVSRTWHQRDGNRPRGA